MRGDTILVVDDSPTDLRLVTRALHAGGYKTVTAADGEAAVSLAVAHKPAVILMDVVMPKKNGFQVCRTLKTTAETMAIPVVLVTGKDQASDRFWGLKQGADDYLTKPFDAATLLATVDRLAP